MNKTQYSHVVLVGRTNVGKSTLFNRLAENAAALAYDQEGVTRDFLTDIVSWLGRSFLLIDTGGLMFGKTKDQLMVLTQERARACLQRADIILFMCDGTAGVTPQDREIMKEIYKLKKPIILVANKMDAQLFAQHVYEFDSLGCQKVVSISAQHGKGIADLLELIVSLLPEKKYSDTPAPDYKVALLGKPNVGKSSLMNLLTKQERSIVSDIPGTTREALIEHVTFYQEDIQLIDTPGVRKKSAVTDQLETLMVNSTLRAVKHADIIVLLLDANAGEVVDQELKLAFFAFQKQQKALIILYNKQDLVDNETKADLDFSLLEYKFFFKKLEQLNISCKDGKNIGRILPVIKKVWERHSQQIPNEELFDHLITAMRQKPLYHQNKRLLLYRAKQIKAAPITILLDVNEPDWYGPSQLAFLEQVLRKNYDLLSVPVIFISRKTFREDDL